MEETELRILVSQQVNEYGMGFVKHESDGSATLLSPKDILVFTRQTNMPPDMLESKTLHDMLLNMRLMELEQNKFHEENIKKYDETHCQNCGTEIEEPGECDDCSGISPEESP